MDTHESIYMCCCPKPYIPCELEKRSTVCDAAVKKFIAPLTIEGYQGDNPKARKLAMVALQQAREMIRGSDKGCKRITASLMPLASCGHPIGFDRSLDRVRVHTNNYLSYNLIFYCILDWQADLFCETVALALML
jgi:hypothetical protein